MVCGCTVCYWWPALWTERCYDTWLALCRAVFTEMSSQGSGGRYGDRSPTYRVGPYQHNPQQHTTQNLIPICRQRRARSLNVTSLTHSHQSAPHNYQVHTRSPHPLLSSPFCTSHGPPTYYRSCHTHTDASVRLGELPACTAQRRHSSSLPSVIEYILAFLVSFRRLDATSAGRGCPQAKTSPKELCHYC
jgi:hypothetical protein